MYWIDEPNARIHLMALHIIAKMTEYVNDEEQCKEWAGQVCKDLFTLGALPKIIDKCRGDMAQPATAQYAASILHNMAKVLPAASRLITKSDALQEAVDIVKLKGSSQTEEGMPIACAKLLAVLSDSEENRADMTYTNDFLPSLESCLQAQIEEVKHCVYVVLANLALDPYMKLRMAATPLDANGQESTSVMQKLIAQHLIMPLNPDSKVEVSRIIANITVDVTTHDKVIRNGPEAQMDKSWEVFIEHCVHELSNTQIAEVQYQYARIFRNLACTVSTRQRIVVNGAPAALFRIIKDTDIKNKQVHYWAAAAIAAIAETPSLHPRIMNQKGLRPLVTFAALKVTGLDDDDVRTRQYAAMTLAELAMIDDNREMLIQEGGLVPLIKWSKGFGNNKVQEAAKEALKYLGVDNSMGEDDMEEEQDDGALEEGSGGATMEIGPRELVGLAKSEMAAVQEYAASEIANMALNRNELKMLIYQGAVEVMAERCCSSNELVAIQSHRALLNLSSEDDEMNLPKLEVAYAKRKDKVDRLVREGKMSKRDIDKEEFTLQKAITKKKGKIDCYIGCLEDLLRQVTSGGERVKTLCIVTLANICCIQAVREKLLNMEDNGDGGLFSIVQVLNASTVNHMRVQAARAVFNLARDSRGVVIPTHKGEKQRSQDCAHKLWDLRVMNICVRNFHDSNPHVKRLCIGIVAQLAGIPELRHRMLDGKINLVQRLVIVAYQDAKVAIVQEQIARCLAMLALHDDFKRQILETHGSQLLIRWAGSSRTSVQVQAAMAISNLLEDIHGRNKDIKVEVIKQGALQVLYTLAQVGDPRARLQVIRVLKQMSKYFRKGGVLSEDWPGVLEFMQEGGITPLIHMTTDPPESEEYRIRVREGAARELIHLLNTTLDHEVFESQKAIRDLACPPLVPLLLLQDNEGIQQSNTGLRLHILTVFEKMLHSSHHKGYAVDRLAESKTVRQELYKLWTEVLNQEGDERRTAKRAQVRAAMGKPAEEVVPKTEEQIEAIHPPDFRKLLKNTITMLRLAGKLLQEDELNNFDAMDDAGGGIDLGFADKMKQADRELREGKTDEAAVSSALDVMQDKMMALEVQKLETDAVTSEKKVFKIVVVGDVKVGKSSIIYRYTNQREPPKSMQSTIGCEYRAKLVERLWGGVTVLLQIFDIQGHDRYRKNVPRSFFKGAHGAVVVFDADKERYQTFWNATDWKKTCDSFFEEAGIPQAPCILLANKADLSNENKFAHVRSADMMADVCRDHGYTSWHAVSAKEGMGLSDSGTTAFDALIDQMLEWDAAGKYKKEDGGGLLDLEEETAAGGCAC